MTQRSPPRLDQAGAAGTCHWRRGDAGLQAAWNGHLPAGAAGTRMEWRFQSTCQGEPISMRITSLPPRRCPASAAPQPPSRREGHGTACSCQPCHSPVWRIRRHYVEHAPGRPLGLLDHLVCLAPIRVFREASARSLQGFSAVSGPAPRTSTLRPGLGTLPTSRCGSD